MLTWLNFKQKIEVTCILCRGYTVLAQPFCHLCRIKCHEPVSFCSLCGLPIEDSETGICGQCVKQPPLFDRCLAPFLYQFPVNKIIQMIKHKSRLELIKPMAEALSDLISNYYGDDKWPDVMMPVPLHRKRLQERGYDQTLLLAKALKKQLNPYKLKIDCKSIKRTVNSLPQKNLDLNWRHKNIRNAFTVNIMTPCEHVAMVDDVLTTGATANEIARLLKSNGVKRVDIWCIARTP